MCNKIIPSAFHGFDYKIEPIPEEGIGWKVFVKGTTTNRLFPVYGEAVLYEHKDGVVKWNGYEVEGFCFFLTEEDAKASLEYQMREYSYVIDRVVRKINYKEGQVSRLDPDYSARPAHIRFALCQEFTVEFEEGEKF